MPTSALWRHLRHAAFTLGLMASASAFAVPITYEFTTVDGHYGSFSYDNALLSTSPPGTTAAGYNLLSFWLDGVSLPNPYIVLDNDNFFHFTDLAYLTSVDNGVLLAALQLYSKGNLFTSNDLAQLDGRTLADFTDPAFNRTRLAVGSGLSVLATLQQVPGVPEPGTGVLMLVGLGGGALWARRRHPR